MFTLCIFLSACAYDPLEFNYNYDELTNTIERVELINYNNSDAHELFEKRNEVIPFDFDKMIVLEILSEESINDFLFELSKIDFMEYWRHYDSPQGISLRLIYINNDFEVISQYEYCYAGSFKYDGNVKRFIGGLSGTIEFVDLVNKYFETQIK